MDLYDGTGNRVGSINDSSVDIVRGFGILLLILAHAVLILVCGKYVDPNNKLTGVGHYVALYYFYAGIAIGILPVGYYFASRAFLEVIPYPNLALILLILVTIVLALGAVLAVRSLYRASGLRPRHIWISSGILFYGPLIVIGIDYVAKWLFLH